VPDPKPTFHQLHVCALVQAAPYEMSLASIKKFIWRKGDDLVFHFRQLDPENPAPLPVLSPS
jgi:hypothetical protein